GLVHRLARHLIVLIQPEHSTGGAARGGRQARGGDHDLVKGDGRGGRDVGLKDDGLRREGWM
ncbi:MAG: hypothetical protein ACK4Y4_07330, partial [Brevundimonas sp.]